MQSNKLLFFAIIGLAIVVVIGQFVARPWLQVAPPIEISVLYSTEKEAWLNEVIADFEGRADGRPIQVRLEKMGSREIYLAELDGSRRPDVISPASSLQIAILQDLSARSGAPLVDATDPTDVLRQMSESTGGKQYNSDPATISQVYAEIALFF